jgi:hypothetical protein
VDEKVGFKISSPVIAQSALGKYVEEEAPVRECVFKELEQPVDADRKEGHALGSPILPIGSGTST